MSSKTEAWHPADTQTRNERLRRLLGRDPRAFSAFVAESFAVAALR
jgi:hypothetical protein